MTQAKSQSDSSPASFSLRDPLTWGLLGAFALSSFLSVSLLTQLSRGTQAEGARASTQLVLGLVGAFGSWPLLLSSLGVVAGSGLLFVQPRRLRSLSAAVAILGALLTLSFALGAFSPGAGGALSGWLAGWGIVGRLAAFAVALVLGLGTVLAGFEALGLDSSGIRGSLRRLAAVGNLSGLSAAIAARTRRQPQERSESDPDERTQDETSQDSHASRASRGGRPSPTSGIGTAVSEPARQQPARADLAGAADAREDRDVVRPLSKRPGSVAAPAAGHAAGSVARPAAAGAGAPASGEPRPLVAEDEAGLNELVVRRLSPTATEKRPIIEPELGEAHEPRAMSTNAVEAARTRVGQRTAEPSPGPMAPIATEDPQPLSAEERAAESAAVELAAAESTAVESAAAESAVAPADPPRSSSNAQRVEESESEWAEVEALIATPTAELVEPAALAEGTTATAATDVAATADVKERAGIDTAVAASTAIDASAAAAAEVEAEDETEDDGTEEDEANAEHDDESWEEGDDEELEEGEWDEVEGDEEGDDEEWEEDDEDAEGEWDEAEESDEDDDGEWEESEEEWEEAPATAEASGDAEEDSEEEWEEDWESEDGEEEDWDEAAEWEEADEDDADEAAEPEAEPRPALTQDRAAAVDDAADEAAAEPAGESVAAESTPKSSGGKSAAKGRGKRSKTADAKAAGNLTQAELFGGSEAEDEADEAVAAGAAREPEPAAEAEPIVELQPAAPDRERLIQEVGLMFIRAERVAVSMLQRSYDLDFDESTAILDELQQRGLIGPYMGGKQRAILMDEASWAALSAD
jgi:hypothetical protein